MTRPGRAQPPPAPLPPQPSALPPLPPLAQSHSLPPATSPAPPPSADPTHRPVVAPLLQPLRTTPSHSSHSSPPPTTPLAPLSSTPPILPRSPASKPLPPPHTPGPHTHILTINVMPHGLHRARWPGRLTGLRPWSIAGGLACEAPAERTRASADGANYKIQYNTKCKHLASRVPYLQHAERTRASADGARRAGLDATLWKSESGGPSVGSAGAFKSSDPALDHAAVRVILRAERVGETPSLEALKAAGGRRPTTP